MVIDIETVSLIVKKYVNDVRCLMPVYKVFLYGSYAKNHATEYSDVDVCFFLTSFGNEDWDDIMLKLLKISRKYREIYIEPMVFEVSDLYDDNPFVKEVLRTGIEIQY
ncbi:MAG: nucleotidyltransferase domain-containing protein [Deltaproteobacteria bacterium]|nr:nucleotidyltransferase domain-containing protein [Deltaproteobacteria bacterium]